MGRRQRRRNQGKRGQYAYGASRFRARRNQFRSRRGAGWGMNLYRNTRDGKIGGVAAGLADHWDIAHWVVRLLWVGAFLFTGSLAFWLYVGAWFVLAPGPSRRREDGQQQYYDADCDQERVDMEYDERSHDYKPKKVFRYSDSAEVRLERARGRLDAALKRVEDMESYVTSRRYSLNKEFSKL
ncbi:MAG: PspC domain-containing protein [Halieaceae bacterium]|jgi:phage shock protein C|nr:PspC domain-containing protein [Halieaceae bacterium]